MCADVLTGHLHGVTRSEGRLLPEKGPRAGERLRHLVGLMAHDDRDGIGAEGLDGPEDVPEKRQAEGLVEDLRPRALHARPLAGGESRPALGPR